MAAPNRTFSGATPPAAANQGDLWVNTTVNRLLLHDGRFFLDAGEVVANVQAFGAKGDGGADDTAAIQAAINAVSLNSGAGPTESGHRGGMVYFPPGIYKVTLSLRISTPNVRLAGPSWGLGNKTATSDAGPAAYILNACPSAAVYPTTYPAALQILGSDAWIVTGVSVENLGFVCPENTYMECVQLNTYTTANGISRVRFEGCAFLGGFKQVRLLGSSYIFDLQFVNCVFQQWNAVGPQTGFDQSVADTAANGGISTVFRDCTFRGHLLQHFKFGSPAGNVTIENCTLESCTGPSIYWLGAASGYSGHLTLIGNHWEGIEQGATPSGGHQVSSVTGAWAGIIFVDFGITQLDIYGPDVQTANAGAAGPANAMPFIVTNAAQNGTCAINIHGGYIAPVTVATQGQPYLRLDRSGGAIVRVIVFGTVFGPVSGSGILLQGTGTLVGLNYVSGIVTQASLSTPSINVNGPIFPSPNGVASQSTAGLFGGAGAPSNADGSNGYFYFRSDGGAGTRVYFKAAGVWVGVV